LPIQSRTQGERYAWFWCSYPYIQSLYNALTNLLYTLYSYCQGSIASRAPVK
jgi:hypothetical protein